MGMKGELSAEDSRNIQPKHTIDLPGDHANRNCREAYGKDDAELALWAYYRALAMSWKDAAEFYDVEETAILYRAWCGKLVGTDLDRALAAFRKVRDASGKNCGPRYANTRMARKVRHALDVARETLDENLPLSEARMIFVGADAGDGKSTVATSFTADNNHGLTCYWQHPRIGGLKSQVQRLADLNNVNSYISYNDLQPRVAACFPHRILIVDDAHKLIENGKKDLPKLDYFLGLHDTVPVIVVLLTCLDKFCESLADTTYNDRQFWRRCRHIEVIDERANDDDIETLFKFKCPSLAMNDKLLKTLGDINAHDEGGFGKVGQIFTDAHFLAKRDSARMTTAHIFTAASKQLEQLEKIHKLIGNRKAGRR